MYSNKSYSRKILFSCILLCSCVGFCVLSVEIIIRGIGHYRKKQIPDYDEVYRKNGMGPGGYLKENFNGMVADGYGGKIEWINNSKGFRSRKEFSRKPESEVLRILSLGDSFTAGYRVRQDKTYSDLINDWLNSQGISCEVLISCIESPYRGLEYLKKEGCNWNPHVVLLGITLGNDITQDYISLNPDKIGFYHGLETYNIPEVCLLNKSLPFNISNYLYRNSRILKMFFSKDTGIVAWYGPTLKPKMFDACHGLGFYIRNTPEVINTAFRRHFQVLEYYSNFCKNNNIRFAALLIPQRFQVQPVDWNATVRNYRLRREAFDLEQPNSLFKKFCSEKNIFLIDPTETMRKAYMKHQTDQFLPNGDMHFNEKGHYRYFEGLKNDFVKLLLSNAKSLSPGPEN